MYPARARSIVGFTVGEIAARESIFLQNEYKLVGMLRYPPFLYLHSAAMTDLSGGGGGGGGSGVEKREVDLKYHQLPAAYVPSVCLLEMEEGNGFALRLIWTGQIEQDLGKKKKKEGRKSLKIIALSNAVKMVQGRMTD